MPDESLNPAAHRRGRIYIILTALLWGLAGVCVKSISWNSLSIMTARSVVSAISLGLFRRSFRMRFTKNNLLAALFNSMTGILYMMGIKNTDAATAIILQYTAPIFVLLFSIVFGGRKPSRREVIIVIAVFFGCVLSFADKMGEGHLLGNLLSLASGMSYAAQIVVFSRPETDSGDSMMISNFISLLICAPFMFFDPAVPATTPTVAVWLAIMCVFQFSLANIFYSLGCKLVSDIECSLLLTIEPIFNPIPVAIFCGEHMGPLAFAGFVIVLAGITMYTVGEKKQKTAQT